MAGDEYCTLGCEHCGEVFWYNLNAVPLDLAIVYFNLHVLACRSHRLMRGELEEEDREILERWRNWRIDFPA